MKQVAEVIEQYNSDFFDDIIEEDFFTDIQSAIIQEEWFQDIRQDAIDCVVENYRDKLIGVVEDNNLILNQAMNYVKYDSIPTGERDMKNIIEKLVDIIEDLDENVFEE